jgi:hypothetical protein
VATFEDPLPDRWADSAWSLVVEVVEIVSPDTLSVNVWFLAGDRAPNDFLDNGRRFQFHEGRHLVAEGEVFD